MEKFTSFGKITNKYLHGDLGELILNYEDENHLQVSVSYEYNNFYMLDYEVEINLLNKSIDFISHRSKGSLNRVNLSREKEFEQAVSDYLFAN